MATSQYIRISSEDKTASSVSNSDFTVALEDKTATQRIKTIIPIQVFCPNVFYNIRSSYGVVNNVLRVQENGQAAVNVVLPEGYYSSDQIITNLAAAVNALMVGSVLTITLDPITKKYTFTFVGNSVILFDNTAGSSMGDAIGLTTTTADINVHIMDEIPNLNGITAVYIHSQQINPGGFLDGDSGATSAFTWVSLSEVPFGAVGAREIQQQDMNAIVYQGKKNLSLISIVLRDAEGNRLPIGNQRITIIFRVSY